MHSCLQIDSEVAFFPVSTRSRLTQHFHFVLDASMRITTAAPRFLAQKFDCPRVSPGDAPLTKEPVDSGYEIAVAAVPEALEREKLSISVSISSGFLCSRVWLKCEVLRPFDT